MNEPRLVKIGKAAQILGTTPGTLRKWEATGELLPTRRTKGGTRYYDAASRMELEDQDEVDEALQDVRSTVDKILPISLETHSDAVQIAREHRFNFHDALIIAAALESQCTELISEDLQARRRINGLAIVNLFLG